MWVIISLGTIFYNGVIVKRDVEHLLIQGDKREIKIGSNTSKINENNKDISILKTEIVGNKKIIDEINRNITEINKQIISSSNETRQLLIKALSGK